jgi:transposase
VAQGECEMASTVINHGDLCFCRQNWSFSLVLDDMGADSRCARRQAVRVMTTNHTTQTDPGARARVIKLGLDIHSSLIVVVRQVDEQPSQPPQRFNQDGFIGFVRRQLAQADSVHSCYEAGPFGFVLHRRLVAMGVSNVIVRPRDWSTYGERVKTDGRDAGALCSCLDRYLSGNLGALAVVWVPSEAEEASRSLGRQRQSLVRDRTRIILRGKSLARLRGLDLASDWWHERIFPKLDVPEDLRAQLAGWQRIVLQIDAEQAALTAQLEDAAPAGLPSYLGALTWELLRREVGDWHRFRNRRQVASYTGLCPSEHSSGRSRQQGSITRHGNPRIRHLLVEAAWRLLRYQHSYHAVAKWREALLAVPCSAARKKKIIVAIARQLAVDLWRLATGRATAHQLGLATA